MRSPILSAALFAAALAFPAYAADNVKIGVIYPLTGNAAPAGNSAKDAVELGLEIVNNARASHTASSTVLNSAGRITSSSSTSSE